MKRVLIHTTRFQGSCEACERLAGCALSLLFAFIWFRSVAIPMMSLIHAAKGALLPGLWLSLEAWSVHMQKTAVCRCAARCSVHNALTRPRTA